MSNRKDVFRGIKPFVVAEYPSQTDDILYKAGIRFESLCLENPNESDALQAHTHEKIYPAIAFYDSVAEVTGNRESGLRILEKYYTTRCKKAAHGMQIILKIPGTYKLVPKLMAKMIGRFFGSDATFEAVHHPVVDGDCRVDMTYCPYHAACLKYGCPDLCHIFCNSDDITYGNLHPKLVWARTKTLGRNDDCCDFRMYIKDDNSTKK